MVVMIIFLILSIVFVVGTVVYLNMKKKERAGNVKQNTTTDTNARSKSKKGLLNILQIKIKDNVICLGNRYSSVIRLGNIDYNMLSQNEQESIEDVLIQTSLSIDYPIQFFSTTEYVDTSKVVALIKQNKTNKTKTINYLIL